MSYSRGTKAIPNGRNSEDRSERTSSRGTEGGYWQPEYDVSTLHANRRWIEDEDLLEGNNVRSATFNTHPKTCLPIQQPQIYQAKMSSSAAPPKASVAQPPSPSSKQASPPSPSPPAQTSPPSSKK
ncbi:MAG: hypothetical protein Q9194_005983 [Teloschistes cf. exilis]